jgi:hypothetical protein
MRYAAGFPARNINRVADVPDAWASTAREAAEQIAMSHALSAGCSTSTGKQVPAERPLREGIASLGGGYDLANDLRGGRGHQRA